MIYEPSSASNRDVLIQSTQQEIRTYVDHLQNLLADIQANQNFKLLEIAIKHTQVLLSVLRFVHLNPLQILVNGLENYFKRVLEDRWRIDEGLYLLSTILSELSKFTFIEKNWEDYLQRHLLLYENLISELKNVLIQNRQQQIFSSQDLASESFLQGKKVIMSQSDTEKIDENFINLFLKELQLQALSLEKNAVAIASDYYSKLHLENLVRLALSIEQAGRVVKLSIVTQMGQALKNCFEQLDQGMAWDQQGMKIIFEVIEILLELSKIEAAHVDLFMQEHKEQMEETVQKLINEINQKNQKEQEFQPATQDMQDLMLDTTIFDLFCIELENQSMVLNSGLVEWEQNPDEKLLADLMRAAHSIKGAAKVVALEPIVRLSHAIEDCLVAVQNKQIELDANKIDRLLQSVDLLSQLSKVEVKNIKQWIQDKTILIDSIINDVLPFSTQFKTIASAQKVLKEKRNKNNYLVTTSSTTLNQPDPAINVKASIKRPETIKAFQTAFTSDRILRVSAQNLNRLMGLAGEALIESRWLYPFENLLQKLKVEQKDFSYHLDLLKDQLNEKYLSPTAQNCLTSLHHKVNECQHHLTERISELDDFIHRHVTLSDRLYKEVINSRMRPFTDGVEGFPRMVRDLARQLGKQIKLEIEGRSTLIDRDILERLESPLSHLLRNAVDHGIESPEERQKLGKPAEGVIKLEARHKGGVLVITVSDDGRGLDLTALRQSLIEKNLLSVEFAHHLTESEIINYLFLPGFSTAKEVSEISGRGIGLNIVQNFVQEVGGVVRTFFSKGKGVSFHLQLPLTLSVIRALVVEISNEIYAFPLARIGQTFLINPEEVEVVENQQFFHYEGRNIGLIAAWQILELEESSKTSNMLPIVIVGERYHSYGLVVDRLIGEKELVVQELDVRLGKIPDISSGALIEDGSSVLIIDVEDIVHSIDQQLSDGDLKEVTYSKRNESQQLRKKILIVDDSLTVREVESRLLKNHGYEVETVVNGIDGWNAIRIGHYDLVITDIDMPLMNGIELIRLIKNDQRLKSLPVMVVSYKEEKEDKMRAFGAGADYYLTKTDFQDVILLEAIQELLKTHHD